MNKYRKILKNYTSHDPIPNIQSKITQSILDFGGNGIIWEFAPDQKVTGLLFKIDIEGQTKVINVPLNTEKVIGILKKQGYYKSDDQCYRVALANIRDWLDAQLAIYSTQMFEFPQIFLPYMQTNSGRTYYEVLKNNSFTLGMD